MAIDECRSLSDCYRLRGRTSIKCYRACVAERVKKAGARTVWQGRFSRSSNSVGGDLAEDSESVRTGPHLQAYLILSISLLGHDAISPFG